MHEGNSSSPFLQCSWVCYITGKTENNPIVILSSPETSTAKEAMQASSSRLALLSLFWTMKA